MRVNVRTTPTSTTAVVCSRELVSRGNGGTLCCELSGYSRPCEFSLHIGPLHLVRLLPYRAFLGGKA